MPNHPDTYFDVYDDGYDNRIFDTISDFFFRGADRLPDIGPSVRSVCDFGVTVMPIIAPAELAEALEINVENLQDAIDAFHDWSSFSINERGPWLTMVYTGAHYGRSMTE
jgi:hypothetical protein